MMTKSMMLTFRKTTKMRAKGKIKTRSKAMMIPNRRDRNKAIKKSRDKTKTIVK